MGFLTMKRVPEPEVMDSESEVEAYSSSAAQAYLKAIDETFVEHVGQLMDNRVQGRVLDLGCGPGQILIMMKQRWPGLDITGLDAAPTMITQAQTDAGAAGVDISFEVLWLGEAGEMRLPYEDAEFDLVTCNSVMHHLADPALALNEIARVAKPGSAVLIKDLLRPPAFAYPLHIRIFGRHYSGEMRRLYDQSVKAAYTRAEFESMLDSSRLNDGRSRVFQRGMTHAGIERPAQR